MRIYVVLSRVRKLDGLYLFDPIDMTESFEPSEQSKQYMICLRIKEKQLLKARVSCMARLQKA